jgi:hypothetical protein
MNCFRELLAIRCSPTNFRILYDCVELVRSSVIEASFGTVQNQGNRTFRLLAWFLQNQWFRAVV